jgi:hypothetical protein
MGTLWPAWKTQSYCSVPIRMCPSLFILMGVRLNSRESLHFDGMLGLVHRPFSPFTPFGQATHFC